MANLFYSGFNGPSGPGNGDSAPRMHTQGSKRMAMLRSGIVQYYADGSKYKLHHGGVDYDQTRLIDLQRMKVWLFGAIPEAYDMRHKVNYILGVTNAGRVWDIFQTSISLVACMVYVLSTYQISVPNVVEWTLTAVFMADYLLRWYGSDVRWQFPFTLLAMVDLITMAPIFIEEAVGQQISAMSFLRFVRVLRVIRLLKAFRAINSRFSAVGRQLATLILTICTIMFLSAGMVHLVENELYERIEGKTRAETVTFGDALYFCIVTASTVGYGDIAPLSTLGKVVVAGMIVLSLVLIPMQVNLLTSLLALRSKFLRSVRITPSNPHVLVFGHVSNSDVLRTFATEFYHPDRLEDLPPEASERRVVIVGPCEPSQDLQTLLFDQRFSDRLEYVKGSVMEVGDMRRVGLHHAECCFVFCDADARDAEAEDRATALRTLMIKNFNPEIPTFVHMNRRENMAIMQQSNADEVLCVEEWKYGMLAQSCLVRGFSTLFVNMMGSTSSGDAENDPEWLQEYRHGAAQEVYTISVPDFFDGLSFSQVFKIVYMTFGGEAVIWGVQEPAVSRDSTEGKERLLGMVSRMRRGSGPAAALLECSPFTTGFVPGRVLLNPGPFYRVKAGMMLYVLADDQHIASLVRKQDIYDPDIIPIAPSPPGYGWVLPEWRKARHSNTDAKSTAAGSSSSDSDDLDSAVGLLNLSQHGASSHATPQPTADRLDVLEHPCQLETLEEDDRAVYESYSSSPMGIDCASPASPAPANAVKFVNVEASPRSGQMPHKMDEDDLVLPQSWKDPADMTLDSVLQLRMRFPPAPADLWSSYHQIVVEEGPDGSRTIISSLGSALQDRNVPLGPMEPKPGQAEAQRTVYEIIPGNNMGRTVEIRKNGKRTIVPTHTLFTMGIHPAACVLEDVPATIDSILDHYEVSNNLRRIRQQQLAATASAHSKSGYGGFFTVINAEDASSLVVSSVVPDVPFATPCTRRIATDQGPIQPNMQLFGHIVVCGTVEGLKGFIAPLRSKSSRGTSMHRPIVVLYPTSRDPTAADVILDCTEYDDVYFVDGEPTNMEDLLRAGIATAHCVTIVANRSSMANVDGQTLDSSVIFTYLMMEQALLSVPKAEDFYMVVEVSNMSNMAVLNNKRLSRKRKLRNFPASHDLAADTQEIAAVQQNFAARRPNTMSSHTPWAQPSHQGLSQHTQMSEASEHRSAWASGSVEEIMRVRGGQGRPRLNNETVRVLLGTQSNSIRANSGRNFEDTAGHPGGRRLGRDPKATRSAPTRRTPGQSSKQSPSKTDRRRLRSRRRSTVAPTGDQPSQDCEPGFCGRAFGAVWRIVCCRWSRRRHDSSSTRSTGSSRVVASDGINEAVRQANRRADSQRSGRQEPKRTLSNDSNLTIAASAVERFDAERSEQKTKPTRGTTVGHVNGAYDRLDQTMPFYAAGFGLATEGLHTILCQAFYNPEVMRFAEQLLSPASDGESSRLSQIPCPVQYHGVSYDAMVIEMLEVHGVVVVGLYRSSTSLGRGNESPLPYVYMAPKRDAIVHRLDFLYILAPPKPDQWATKTRPRPRRSSVAVAAAASAPAAPGQASNDEGEMLVQSPTQSASASMTPRLDTTAKPMAASASAGSQAGRQRSSSTSGAEPSGGSIASAVAVSPAAARQQISGAPTRPVMRSPAHRQSESARDRSYSTPMHQHSAPPGTARLSPPAGHGTSPSPHRTASMYTDGAQRPTYRTQSGASYHGGILAPSIGRSAIPARPTDRPRPPMQGGSRTQSFHTGSQGHSQYSAALSSRTQSFAVDAGRGPSRTSDDELEDRLKAEFMQADVFRSHHQRRRGEMREVNEAEVATLALLSRPSDS